MLKRWFSLLIFGLSILFNNVYAAPILSDDSNQDRLGIIVDIGEGIELEQQYPANYYWKNSLSQQLFYPEEIGYEGLISSISFYYNFVESPLDPCLNIWLGETEQNDLSAGNIPASQLQLVYSGAIPDYLEGDGEIYLELQDFYDYYGDNLVVLVERPMDTQYWASLNKFYVTNDPAHPHRAWNRKSDTIDFDPNQVYEDGELNSYHSNISFCIYQGGTFYGLIQDNNQQPLADVLVECNNQQTLSDENGEYLLQHVFPSSSSVSFSKAGYQTFVTEEYNFSDTEVIELDVTMQQLTEIEIGTDETSCVDLPIYYWYKNSLSETIYYANELSEAGLEMGLITEIAYHYTEALVLPEQSIRIWIGETDLNSLPEEWITSEEMMLVYDGEMIIEEEEGWLQLPFMEPYPYSGRNLVILVQRPMHYNYGGNLSFYNSQTAELPERTLLAYSDQTEINPEDIQVNFSYHDKFPNTRFYLGTEEWGALNGIVQDEDGQALEGVKITLGEHNLFTISDLSGSFEFPIFSTGTYSLYLEKEGYQSTAINNVSITAEHTTEIEVDLEPLVGITGEEIALQEIKLAQNYPNPFILSGKRQSTIVQYQLPAVVQSVELEIFNLKGQKVRSLRNENGDRQGQFSWDGQDFSGVEVGSGIYFYRLQAGHQTEMKRLILLK